MPDFPHEYPFDPRYGYTQEQLLQIGPPETEPEGFVDYWKERFARTARIDPKPILEGEPWLENGRLVQRVAYTSTDNVTIRGWLTRPLEGPLQRGLVVLHGYGGREAPEPIPATNAVALFPCLRGLSLSALPGIPADDCWQHVLVGIEDKETYIHGGCIEDIWLAASALLALHPEVEGRLGLIGGSFGGGLGTLALPWDNRFLRAQFTVPTFGHWPLRLQCESVGSGEPVRQLAKVKPAIIDDTLRWYDAATAATHVRVPVTVAPAAFDPAVAPPGQYAVANSYGGQTTVFPLPAGHYEYPGIEGDYTRLHEQLIPFFDAM